jgi:predicted DNA-binding transcriptional regulator AlpA
MEDRSSSIRLINKAALAQELGVTKWTVDRWCKARTFPQPLYVSDGAPARWRVADVEAWLAKRAVARRRSYGFRRRP